MHSPLDTYLEQVAAHLFALPPKRREEELREMRQHLLNAVTVNREAGQLEEDAAQNAVLQFGTAADLGDNLEWAWRRERRLNKRSLTASTLISLLGLCLIIFVAPSGAAHVLDPFVVQMGKVHHWSLLEIQTFLFLTYDLPLYSLLGAATGLLFPKRAAQGTSLIVTAWTVCLIVPRLCWEELVYRPNTFERILGLFVCDVMPSLIAIASASFISRWQITRMNRASVTQG